jgi:hypothetical protein
MPFLHFSQSLLFNSLGLLLFPQSMVPDFQAWGETQFKNGVSPPDFMLNFVFMAIDVGF